MIQIIRPVYEVNKPIPKAEGKELDNNTKENKNYNVINTYEFQGEEYKYTGDDLKKAVNETNKMIFGGNSHFEFQVHEKTGAMMVKLIDNNTNEVIKEIPPEKILDLVANIWELVGIIVDEKG
ncbi:MAG: flagellar protein FlaG [Eubacteriaceae bacterium]